tara:strand:- start:60 stop:1037 length:978 start_codon:yes stop_codon:yes gene_type:complete
MTGGVGGKPENVHSTRKENIKKKNWLRNMITSTKNFEVLQREMTVDGVKPDDREVQKVIDARLKNLNTVSVSMADEPIGNSWESIYGSYEPPKEKGLQNIIDWHKRNKDEDITMDEAKELYKEYKRAGKTTKEHHITLQPQEDYWGKNTNLEEYLHSIKGGPEGGSIPEKTLDLIDKYAVGGADSKYVTIPEEFTAQFNSVKYSMEEKGLFNPMEEDFTEEHYDKLIEGDHVIKMSNHFQRMMLSLKENFNDKGHYIGPSFPGNPEHMGKHWTEDSSDTQTEKQKEELKKIIIKLMNNISVQTDEPKDDKQTWASIGKEAYMGGV